MSDCILSAQNQAKSRFPYFSPVKTLLVALFALFSLNVPAQDIDPKKLLSDVEILSSDKFEGRRTGTPGNRLAADYIISRFKAMGIAPYQKNDYRQPFTFKNGQEAARSTGINLIGVIPGKTKDAIVISAHYDHLGVRNGRIYNGADDNASGVGGLLAIAGYFKKNKPNHTMIIAAFDAEESGLQGAKAFVAATPLAGIRLNVNMDMISHSDKSELYVCGTFAYPGLRNYIGTTVPGIRLLTGHDHPASGHDDWTNQSDQGAFHARKIPFLYFGVEDHKDYHQPTDKYSTITTGFYISAVKAILQVVNNYDKHIPATGN
jgi:Zn-dependent M28 family amino/carboxypeptidase